MTLAWLCWGAGPGGAERGVRLACTVTPRSAAHSGQSLASGLSPGLGLGYGLGTGVMVGVRWGLGLGLGL